MHYCIPLDMYAIAIVFYRVMTLPVQFSNTIKGSTFSVYYRHSGEAIGRLLHCYHSCSSCLHSTIDVFYWEVLYRVNYLGRLTLMFQQGIYTLRLTRKILNAFRSY